MQTLLCLIVVALAPAESDAVGADPPETAAYRRFGVHLGLNATAAFDVEVARHAYFEVATQLTGIGAIFAPNRGLVVSAFVLAGYTTNIVERPDLRLAFDVGVHGTYLHSYPVNLLSIGVAAGLRLVHRSGFTFAFKLPLVGYAGSPDQPRGGLFYYYVAAIPTVPVVTFGYSF